MLKRILILLMFSIVLLGCKERDLNIKIRYDEIQGLREGDWVIFEQNYIGNVTRVFYSKDGHYIAELSIKKDFANAATEYSRFFITDDSHDDRKKAVEMIQIRKGGSPLQDGAIVVGSAKSAAVLSQMREDLQTKLKDLKKQFEQFFDDLSSVPETEEFKRLEKELERLAQEMNRSGKQARERIQKELLPRLKEEIEKLRERLRKFGREEELEPLEIQIEKITAI